jgi:hypothetical protein
MQLGAIAVLGTAGSSGAATFWTFDGTACDGGRFLPAPVFRKRPECRAGPLRALAA